MTNYDGTRLYVGGLNPRVNQDDVKSFLKGYGPIKEVIMKSGFCFVEMEDRRDASDAAHDLNGRDMKGNRISVEIAKGTPHGRDRFADAPRPYNQPTYVGRGGGGGYRGGSSRYEYSRGGGDYRDRGRPPIPDRSAYRVNVENLASGASWQELKNFMRQAGDVVFADVDSKRNEGIVEFASMKDMQRALDKLDGTEFLGRKIRMNEKRGSSSSGRRRSPSPRHSRSRSRTRTRSRSRSRGGGDRRSSYSSSRSRSRTPDEKRSSKTKNGNRSPARKSSERSNEK